MDVPSSSSSAPQSAARSLPRSLFRNRWVLIGGGAAALIVLAVVIAFVFLMRAVDRPGEATAQYIPSDAALYLSVNLRPGTDQIMKAKGFADRMEKRDFAAMRDELLDELEEETSIDFPDDLMSWIGTDATLAVLEADMDETVWVMMAQVADADEAEDFAERLRSYFEDQLYEEFEEEDDGLRIWALEDEEDDLEERVAIGLSDEYLFIADTQDTIEDMMDNLGSPPDSPCLSLHCSSRHSSLCRLTGSFSPLPRTKAQSQPRRNWPWRSFSACTAETNGMSSSTTTARTTWRHRGRS